MDKRDELKNLIKEIVVGEIPTDQLSDIQEKMAASDEANAKYLEDNKEIKDKLDAMQEKIVTFNTKTAGKQQFVFKGFDPNTSKNFKSMLTEEDSNSVAKAMIEQVKSGVSGSVLNKTYDASSAIPVQYGNAVMGLGELSSVALQDCTVIVADTSTIKLPSKGTREAVDSQSPGTANVVGQQTIGQITWTIDKIVGTYIELLTTQIDDANFDIVNQVIIPLQAEAVGQNFDTEVFNGGEFTSSIYQAPASVTVSGTSAMAAAITRGNLNTMFYAPTWERGNFNPKWYGSRAVLKDVIAVDSTNGDPLFMQTPLNGKPSQTIYGSEYRIVPTIANVPADGAIRLAFGDLRHYTIFIRGSQFVSMVNPFIKMKEHTVQFICTSRADGNISDNATPGLSEAFTTLLRTDA